MDQDYISKLSDKEKEWLSNFNEEYLSGNFQHPGKIFHKTKKSKRECYTRNNARNRDLYSNLNSIHMLKVSDEAVASAYKDAQEKQDPNRVEDALIDLVDAHQKKSKVLKSNS